MFKNFIVSAIRNLYKQKGYFFINIIGLAIGLTSFIFISLYVIHEHSYDRFHEDYNQIYRVKVTGQMSGQVLDQAVTAAPMARALKDDFPEIENVVRINRSGAWLMRYKEKAFNEDGLLFADSTFFDIFSFKLIEGDPKKALLNPQSIVMTKSYAEKYFGDEDPIGKMISVESDTVFYTVTGIMEDVPDNSHFHFDMMASLNTLRMSKDNNWVSHNYYTYIRVKEGTNQQELEAKLQSLVVTYVGPQLKQILGFSLEDFKNMGNFFGYYLQPISYIHLNSKISEELEPNGNIAYINIFSIIAILILIIAIINFINLSTAKSATRSKEVGIKKTIGASKGSLIVQFIGESLLLTLIAIIVSVLAVSILTPNFNNFLGIEMIFGLFNNAYGIPLLIGLLIVVGFMAGTYPAFVLASFRPVVVLKGGVSKGAKSGIMRSILVVSQFVISITIIIGTLVVYKQLDYMQSKDIGFDKENMLCIRRPDGLKNHIESFKAEILKNSNVINVGNSSSIPGKQRYSNNGMFVENDPDKNTYLLMQNRVSLEYPKVMGFELAEGRFFDKSYGTDSSAIIINEAAVKVLGLENPIGKNLQIPREEGQWLNLPIIGVMKDYNIQSLHLDIAPVALTVMRGNQEGYLVVRLNKNNIRETVEFIEQTWNSYSYAMPFNYFFFKENYNNLYNAEVKTGKIFTIFALLAILIASLGLLGLITYTALIKTKEIGIRKAHGASVISIVKLLSTEIVKLVFIASIISWPVAYFGTDYWLNSFADRINVSWVYYLSGTLITLIIGWLSISYQTIKIALSNPVDALRYE